MHLEHPFGISKSLKQLQVAKAGQFVRTLITRQQTELRSPENSIGEVEPLKLVT